jgi:tetratricopeptide (TPR) repeat protein
MELALKAAERADAVFQVDAYSRYVGAWQAWTPGQRRQFREGQEAHAEGRAKQREKDYDAARAAYERSLDLADPLGDLWGTAQAEQALGDLAMGRGDFDEAIRRHLRALEIFGSLRHTGMLRSCRALGAAYEKTDRLADARAVLERMVAAAKEAGREEAAAPVKADLGRICRALGDEEAAKRYEAEAGSGSGGGSG